MGRPAELPDRLYPVEPITAFADDLSITRETTRITRYISDYRRRRQCQPGRLVTRPCARRVEHHGTKSSEFFHRQRATIEIAVVGEHLASRTSGGCFQ